jgi:hypothetical protein
MFWLAAPSEAHPQGYESDLLSASASADAPGTKTFRYTLPAAPPAARVTARLRLQSIGLDVLDDFAGLQLPIVERVLNNVYQNSPTLRSRVPTITVPGTERELVRNGDSWSESPPAARADCSDQSYVSLLAND